MTFPEFADISGFIIPDSSESSPREGCPAEKPIMKLNEANPRITGFKVSPQQWNIFNLVKTRILVEINNCTEIHSTLPSFSALIHKTVPTSRSVFNYGHASLGLDSDTRCCIF